jgi:hypothetical protein
MTAAGIVVFVAGSIGALSLWQPLRNHRIDIGIGQHPKEGVEPIASLNILNPQNYDDRGQKMLKWLYLFTVLQFVGIGVLFSTV